MLFLDNIAVEQGVIVAVFVIALFIFTRFWCTPHVQSKPSRDFALRQGSPNFFVRGSHNFTQQFEGRTSYVM